MRLKVDGYNALPGDPKFSITRVMDCPVCHNKGNIAEIRDGRIVYLPCACWQKRKNMRHIQQSGLKDALDRYTMDKFTTAHEWQRRMKDTATDYLRERNGWLIASGRPGSGKTHLCTAVCGELMNSNVGVIYFQWRLDSPKLKAIVNDADTYAEELNRLCAIQCLYIDDFFKGAVTDGDKKLAFSILNARYNNTKLLTIISSELSIEEIIDIDEAIGSRMYERSKGHYIRVSGDDKNVRLEQ